MYKTILVTVDGTVTDRAIIEHVKQLAKLAQSRVVVLHVADGWAARTYGPDAVSREISEDTAYLEKVREEFQSAGISAVSEMAYGEPANEIIKWVREKGCDLVAMSTHGHRFISRDHGHAGAAQYQRASAVAAGKIALLALGHRFLAFSPIDDLKSLEPRAKNCFQELLHQFCRKRLN